METKIYKVKVYEIDYCVSTEDVDDGVTEPSDEEIEQRIKAVKEELPQSLTLDIECDDPSDLDDLVVNEVTETTGWLNYSVKYDII